MTFMEQIAIKKMSNKPGWLPCIFEHTNGGILIRGGVPVGERDGRPKWGPKKSLDQVIVSDSDIRQAEMEFEKETGKCSECLGEGKLWSRFGTDIETEYRKCGKCNGSGLKKGV